MSDYTEHGAVPADDRPTDDELPPGAPRGDDRATTVDDVARRQGDRSEELEIDTSSDA